MYWNMEQVWNPFCTLLCCFWHPRVYFPVWLPQGTNYFLHTNGAWKWAVKPWGLNKKKLHTSKELVLCANILLKYTHNLIFERNCSWLSGSKYTVKILVPGCVRFSESHHSWWKSAVWLLDSNLGYCIFLLSKCWWKCEARTYGCCFTFSFLELKRPPKNWTGVYKHYCFIPYLWEAWPPLCYTVLSAGGQVYEFLNIMVSVLFCKEQNEKMSFDSWSC